MIYNILLIDEDISNNKYIEILKHLEESEVVFANTKEDLANSFLDKEIHLIILNDNILTLSDLKTVLDNNNLNDGHIPIFLMGSYNETKLQHINLSIYDFIDIDFSSAITLNKIKFCKKLYQKELQHKSNIQELLYIDNLTKLPNRTKLIKDIQDDNNITALAIIDIESFKDINEFFGLKIGDKILTSVVDIINNVTCFVLQNVRLYKFSADVYCLANIKLPNEAFEEIVSFILGSIEGEIFEYDGHEIDIRAKAGVTFSDKKNKLITADIALKEAKKRNKDYLVFYDELDNLNEYQNNMTWTKKLKHALDNDNIIVYYQPLVNNKTMNVDKYECLVRMLDEEKVISPFFFLEISKKANQYKTITKIVIEKAFKEFENLDFEFSINVSYEDIEDKYFLYFVQDKLKQYNIAKKVVWEILEDESIKNYDVLLNFIKEVKALGCKVAIDDFGSGYSNFEHLLKMDVDYLKIDASLVKNVAIDENSHKVVKTVIDFARSLNLKTITEYVENEDIFNITKKLGSNYSQGYYFSAPIPTPSLKSF